MRDSLMYTPQIIHREAASGGQAQVLSSLDDMKHAVYGHNMTIPQRMVRVQHSFKRVHTESIVVLDYSGDVDPHRVYVPVNSSSEDGGTFLILAPPARLVLGARRDPANRKIQIWSQGYVDNRQTNDLLGEFQPEMLLGNAPAISLYEVQSALGTNDSYTTGRWFYQHDHTSDVLKPHEWGGFTLDTGETVEMPLREIWEAYVREWSNFVHQEITNVSNYYEFQPDASFNTIANQIGYALAQERKRRPNTADLTNADNDYNAIAARLVQYDEMRPLHRRYRTTAGFADDAIGLLRLLNMDPTIPDAPQPAGTTEDQNIQSGFGD